MHNHGAHVAKDFKGDRERWLKTNASSTVARLAEVEGVHHKPTVNCLGSGRDRLFVFRGFGQRSEVTLRFRRPENTVIHRRPNRVKISLSGFPISSGRLPAYFFICSSISSIDRGAVRITSSNVIGGSM